MLLQSMRMALKSISGNKMRSILTMLGVVIGVVAIVVLVAIAQGANRAVVSRIEGLGTNLLSVTVRARRGGNALSWEMLDELRKKLADEDVMIAGPGGCRLCEVCAAKTNEPCRFPDKRHYSMEGSGMDIVSMSRKFNMTYNGGDKKVGYFMIVMYN